MRREGLLASASSPTGFRHSVALEVSTLTFRDVQRSRRPQCKESLAVANKPQSRHAAAPRIAMSAFGGKADITSCVMIDTLDNIPVTATKIEMPTATTFQFT